MGNPELDRNARRRDTAMDYETCPNLVHLFFSRAAEKGDRPFLWAKRNGIYAPLGWRQTAETVSRLAAGLKSLGVAKGDRVMLVAENRPEWLIADVAIMAAGGITVPAYTTNTVQDHHHILTDSGAKGAIVSGDRLARNLLPAARESGTMGFVIGMEPIGDEGGDGIAIHAWEDLLAGAEADVEATAAAAPWRRDDTACIIYTSGTGGAPKGVMLHHGAILHNCRGAYDFLLELGLAEETFLSFLPLSHSYEHTAGQFFPISIGAQIYYAEGVETLSANLQEARPTLMTAVPRLYEMMRGRILRGVTAQGGLKEKLFLRAVDVGRKRIIEPRQLSLADRLLDPLLEKAVRNKVRQRFGGRLKALVSGGAPLNPDVGLFFSALGMRVLQGYGQTESAPVISLNRPNKVKMHTVGPPLVRRRRQDCRGRRDSGPRRAGHARLLGQSASDRRHHPRRLAAYGRHRTIRPGRLPGNHRPQEGHHRQLGRRQPVAAESGGADYPPAGVPSGHGPWRPAAPPGRSPGRRP